MNAASSERAELVAAEQALADFDGQFRPEAIPPGTPNRRLIEARTRQAAFAASCRVENIARRCELGAAVARASRSLGARRAAAQREADPMTALRRTAQAALRAAGFVRDVTSGSGSNYYTRPNGQHELLRIRLADHELPETPEREWNRAQGRACCDFEIILTPDMNAEAVRTEVRDLLVQL